MSRLDVMEWLGAGSVATAAGMTDVRLGLVTAGLWLLWVPNAPAIIRFFGNSGGDDGPDTE